MTYSKNCSNCGAKQTYGRKDHFKQAVKADWKCKSCSSSSNNFKGKYKDIPITWVEVKRRGGLARGYQWDLTIEYLWELYINQNKKCALSGMDIGWSEKGLTSTASIDRIDNSEGYIIGNVQLLHKDVNFMKQQFNQEYFIEVCKAIADKVKW